MMNPYDLQARERRALERQTRRASLIKALIEHELASGPSGQPQKCVVHECDGPPLDDEA